MHSRNTHLSAGVFLGDGVSSHIFTEVEYTMQYKMAQKKREWEVLLCPH